MSDTQNQAKLSIGAIRICHSCLIAWTVLLGFAFEYSVFAETTLESLVSKAILDAEDHVKRRELSPADAGLLLKTLSVASSDRTRLLIPIPQRARRSDTPNVKLPAELKRSMIDIASELVEQSKVLATAGNSADAYQSLFRAAAIDPNQVFVQKLLASQIEALHQRRITSQVNQPNAQLSWPARSYSQIITPHFRILSQAPGRISDDMATLCERTYCVWQQMFFDYWCDASILNDRLDGKSGSLEPTRQFNVVLFGNRQAYLQTLQKIEPNIGISTGYYSPKLKCAFFYWENDRTAGTIQHELVHQFFHEGGRTPSRLDSDSESDFWIVEGIALYMEGVTRSPGVDCDVIDVGGWDSPRLQAARYRRLHDEFWIPWEEFRRATGRRFRDGAEVALWYSQAAGLAHLWMDSGRPDRKALANYIESVYQNKPAPTSLTEIGNDDALRARYDRFLMPSRELIRSGRESLDRSDIVLTHLNIDSNLFLAWPPQSRRCNWLDLSFTKVNDKLFQVDSDSRWDCVRLNVESTEVSDVSMAAIAAMPRLEELDLSNCLITDEGLEKLKGHRTLKTLWLSGTKVTDRSLSIFDSIPTLTYVSSEKTSLTREWKKGGK